MIRFMTWNIKTGGVDRHGDRLEAIRSVLDEQQPDLVCLQELRGFERHGKRLMGEFAAALGLTPHLARSFLGQSVAILARRPLRFSKTRSIGWRLHHAAGSVTIPTAQGPLRVLSAHLNPFSPERRRREAVWLSARYSGKHGLTLVAGDLNGLAPGEDHTAALAPLPRQFLRRHADFAGTVDTRALAAFASAGFADLGSGSGPTVPTTAGGGREFPGTRLDYTLASRALAERASGYFVVRGGATEYASDHYPVRVDFDLDAR